MFRDHAWLNNPRTREILLFVGLLAGGFLILPGVAWLMGTLLLGPQGEGIASIYVSVFGEAARGRPAAWLFAASPWLVVQTLRLLFWPFRHRASSGSSTPEETDAGRRSS